MSDTVSGAEERAGDSGELAGLDWAIAEAEKLQAAGGEGSLAGWLRGIRPSVKGMVEVAGELQRMHEKRQARMAEDAAWLEAFHERERHDTRETARLMLAEVRPLITYLRGMDVGVYWEELPDMDGEADNGHLPSEVDWALNGACRLAQEAYEGALGATEGRDMPPDGPEVIDALSIILLGLIGATEAYGTMVEVGGLDRRGLAGIIRVAKHAYALLIDSAAPEDEEESRPEPIAEA